MLPRKLHSGNWRPTIPDTDPGRDITRRSMGFICLYNAEVGLILQTLWTVLHVPWMSPAVWNCKGNWVSNDDNDALNDDKYIVHIFKRFYVSSIEDRWVDAPLDNLAQLIQNLRWTIWHSLYKTYVLQSGTAYTKLTLDNLAQLIQNLRWTIWHSLYKTYERLNMSIIISIASGTLWFSSPVYSMFSSAFTMFTVSLKSVASPSSSSL